jgi:hypothetical protein
VSVRVTEGGARVVAYVSNIEPSGDQWFLAAERVPETRHSVFGPAIARDAWRTDFGLLASRSTLDRAFVHLLGSADVAVFFPPAAHSATLAGSLNDGLGVLQLDLPAHTMSNVRIRNGDTHQGVPFRPLDDQTEHHLSFIENSAGTRTNIGVIGELGTTAEVVVYDAAGVERERRTLVTVDGFAQMPVTVPVSAGRAVVRILSRRGWAYSSVVDRATGDASFFN